MRVKPAADEKPVRFVLDERLDFNHSVPLRKAYIVASSYRSGSNYLCWQLWQTGVLGAPVEFLNPYDALPVLMNRFKASSPSDYITKLVARRSTKNGVFGLKTHYHHFEAFLKRYPSLLEALSPLTFVHIKRGDQLAQAVSMAKALQTDFWTSRIESERPPLQYDRELIAKCLEEVRLQELKWPRWFEMHNITPFAVLYEDMIADTPGVVRRIVELLGVQNDERDDVRVPPTRKQGDDINRDWIERFEQETRTAAERREDNPEAAKDRVPVGGVGAEASTKTDRSHFFDRYDRFIQNLPAAPDTATGFVGVIRSRHRYEAVVSRNRELFRNARVLDMMGSDGLWSLAALDAGAAHVVRLESSQERVEAAKEAFGEYGFEPESYRVVNAEPLGTFNPEAFDLILCEGFLEASDPRLFFHELHRLRPKHIILDTVIVRGKGPIARFTLASRDESAAVAMGQYATIMGTPSHELIMLLCEFFDFRWRRINWHAMGITNWTGIHDYERDERRTYVLERSPEV